MANKITSEDIILINKTYYECKNKAETSRRTGFSAYAVNKYIDYNWVPAEQIKYKHFTHDMLPEFDIAKYEILPPNEWWKMCILSDEEKAEIDDLHKEILV